MAVAGDEYVRELLSVTILERIGDDKDILSIVRMKIIGYDLDFSDVREWNSCSF